MIKCVPTSKALNVHHRSPPPQPVHKARDGGGLWWMRLEPPSRGLYRDINQLSASDKIRCSGTECFSKSARASSLLFPFFSAPPALFPFFLFVPYPRGPSARTTGANPLFETNETRLTDHFFTRTRFASRNRGRKNRDSRRERRICINSYR